MTGWYIGNSNLALFFTIVAVNVAIATTDALATDIRMAKKNCNFFIVCSFLCLSGL